MGLPQVQGEFAVVFEPELRFSESGAAWLKIRGVAKDRRYNVDEKKWEDVGDPLFMDIIVSGKVGENLLESVSIGDLILVTGKMQQREWEKEGVVQKAYQIRADEVGVAVKFGPAKTPKTIENGGSAPATAKGNAAPPQADEAPF